MYDTAAVTAAATAVVGVMVSSSFPCDITDTFPILTRLLLRVRILLLYVVIVVISSNGIVIQTNVFTRMTDKPCANNFSFCDCLLDCLLFKLLLRERVDLLAL